MSTPDVEVVIAVHTASRPIRRAVESVLDAGVDAVALVVAHEVPAVDIESNLTGLLEGGRVRVVEFSDGIRSPAGPFNHGLEVAESEFVVVLGSDDSLERGALDAALARARRDAADAVILPLRVPGAFRVRAPLPRRGRTSELDAAEDRLYGRSAPLALIRREVVAALAPVFDPLFETGEDVEFGARLWSTARTSYGHLDPAYVIGVDATDRVTEQDAELSRTLAAARALVDKPWVAALDESMRRALAIKMLRVSVLGAMMSRTADPAPIDRAEIEILVETRRRWLAVAPTAERVFPIADRWLLDACRSDTNDATLRRAVRHRSGAWLVPRTLTRNPLRAFGRESVLRRYAISARLDREERVAR